LIDRHIFERSNFLLIDIFRPLDTLIDRHRCFQSDVIDVKGRIACELSSADELLLTEMMFNGVFNDLTPEQSAAVLSCFVSDEKCNELPKMAQVVFVFFLFFFGSATPSSSPPPSQAPFLFSSTYLKTALRPFRASLIVG
jgi:hypothetical protein